jgi:hypothetical protein
MLLPAGRFLAFFPYDSVVKWPQADCRNLVLIMFSRRAMWA